MVTTWQAADISDNAKYDGDLEAALRSIRCPAIVMPCDTDLYFPPEDNMIEVAQMPESELRIIPSVYGHIAGLPGFAPPEDDAFIDQGFEGSAGPRWFLKFSTRISSARAS